MSVLRSHDNIKNDAAQEFQPVKHKFLIESKIVETKKQMKNNP